MNWKLIFLLSLFGLGMAIGTISLIPMPVENILWPIIFIFCAWIIAANVTKNYFFTGFMVSIFNCVWITGLHYVFSNTYMASHPDMVAKMNMGFMKDNQQMAMLIIGPIVGIISGLVLGLFSWIASKIVKKPGAVTKAA